MAPVEPLSLGNGSMRYWKSLMRNMRVQVWLLPFSLAPRWAARGQLGGGAHVEGANELFRPMVTTLWFGGCN